MSVLEHPLSCTVGGINFSPHSSLPTRPAWERATPLGLPVEPEVKITQAVRSNIPAGRSAARTAVPAFPCAMSLPSTTGPVKALSRHRPQSPARSCGQFATSATGLACSSMESALSAGNVTLMGMTAAPSRHAASMAAASSAPRGM